jgi:hypothetical protein
VICGKILVAWQTQFIPVVSTVFFCELRRRKVYRVAVGYGVVGWLIIQFAATVLPALRCRHGRHALSSFWCWRDFRSR